MCIGNDMDTNFNQRCYTGDIVLVSKNVLKRTELWNNYIKQHNSWIENKLLKD